MSINKLVFDIETVGVDFDSLDETTRESLARWIKPARTTDAVQSGGKESSSKTDYEEALRELKSGLGFSPLTGEIVVVGVLDCGKNQGVVYFQAPGENIKEFSEDNITFKQATEKEMLEKFWQGAKEYDEFIGFNSRGFDVPFIMVRSAIHGVKPTRNLMEGRYLYQQRDAKHIDLQDQLTFYGAVWKKGNLHLWSRAFGIKSPKSEGITGDDVGQLFKDKKFLEIAKYNAGDLRATRELYEKWEKYLNI